MNVTPEYATVLQCTQYSEKGSTCLAMSPSSSEVEKEKKAVAGRMRAQGRDASLQRAIDDTKGVDARPLVLLALYSLE